MASMIEYALLVGTIGVATALSLPQFGQQIRDQFKKVADQLDVPPSPEPFVPSLSADTSGELINIAA